MQYPSLSPGNAALYNIKYELHSIDDVANYASFASLQSFRVVEMARGDHKSLILLK